ncbi:hypothetical protein [Enterococcus sp. HY326]|uniref:hypothetical protein n=1 Tax=Enterococcus sp. HY326 TaxID=2971265 RepID=UPI00223EFDB5|nr:hypothetical protein [Enterococcus sp. HY326]
MTILIAAIAGFFGILVGAILVIFAFNLRIKYDEGKERRSRELEYTVKEIETLNLLNQKVNEILQKRNLFRSDYVSFDSFDDNYITIDDFVFLQTFTSQNNFYLPTYLVEEFFKNNSHRRVILSPEETVRLGGYTYKGGRALMETFSDDLVRIMEEKKIYLKQLSNQPLSYFVS